MDGLSLSDLMLFHCNLLSCELCGRTPFEALGNQQMPMNKQMLARLKTTVTALQLRHLIEHWIEDFGALECDFTKLAQGLSNEGSSQTKTFWPTCDCRETSQKHCGELRF